MSNKNIAPNGTYLTDKLLVKDCRDVELTYLKKVNNEYSSMLSPCENEQGEKRGRTPSDNEYDLQFNGHGTPKRTRSVQRKPRTITNSSYIATTTTTTNKNFPLRRMGDVNNQLFNKQNDTMVNSEGNYNNKFNITNDAVAYSVDQIFPPIKIICDPKVNEHKDGANIIKELFKLIVVDFKQVNPKHNEVIGFESWYIDSNGNLQCITRDVELFLYLCDVQHIPNMLLDTKITIVLPKHLPSQCSVIIKGVPITFSIDDVKNEIMNKYKSMYSLIELIGTNNGKTRYLRLDLTDTNEYKQLLNSGLICIDGQCLHVFEYLAAPRVLFCSMCNLPGHNRKYCNFTFDRCRRCGEDRKNGDHKNCAISCHNCKGEHVSTDFRCQTVQNYRRDLIHYLKQHPERLPMDTQFFIPSQYRSYGESVLYNRRSYPQLMTMPPNRNFQITNDEWPSLPPPARSNINYSNYTRSSSSDTIKNLQIQLNHLDKCCSIDKKKYEKINMEIKSQLNESLAQLKSLNICFSTIIQRQNETIIMLKDTINECLEINKYTIQAVCLMMTKSSDQQYEEIIKQISNIPIAERQSSIDKIFSTYTPLIDELTSKIMDITKQMQVLND
ncbi:unnamed protein product [Rotaria sordida]|uniref:CCHC-type domain-containing protein n=2 Tax=Rotaria sordida TaxID=392033 RepID=A0A814HTU5_9BILA|nr:unnamed protein product [Rotaria sordida]CAF3801678.1 unnamed protein product [Rotaria sordida]